MTEKEQAIPSHQITPSEPMIDKVMEIVMNIEHLQK